MQSPQDLIVNPYGLCINSFENNSKNSKTYVRLY